MLIDDVAVACVAAGPVADVVINSATPVELFGVDLKKPVLYGAGNILAGKVWGTYADTGGNDTITYTFKVDGVSIGTAVTAAITAAGGQTGRVIFDWEILTTSAPGATTSMVHWHVNVVNTAGTVIAEAHGHFDATIDQFADHVFTLEAQVSVTVNAPTYTVCGFRAHLFPSSQSCWFDQTY